MKQFEITKEIGVDAAHRVTFHGSKCRNLHGHRYTVQATVMGGLRDSGEEQGMVMDFSFLKELMMEEIDAKCDHGCIVWEKDVELLKALFPDQLSWRFGETSPLGKVYILSEVPTAENLAAHWFSLLAPRVIERSNGNAKLTRVRVWETPSSYCDAS